MGFLDKIKNAFKKAGESISNFFNPYKKQLEQERREKEELKRQLEEERKKREELERQLQKEREEKEKAEQEMKRLEEQQKQLQEQVLALQQQIQEILKILSQLTTQKPKDERLERMKTSIEERETHNYKYMVYYCSPQDKKIMVDKNGNIAKIIDESGGGEGEGKYEDSDFEPEEYCQPLGFNNKRKAIQFLRQVVKKYGGHGAVEDLRTKEMIYKVGEPEW